MQLVSGQVDNFFFGSNSSAARQGSGVAMNGAGTLIATGGFGDNGQYGAVWYWGYNSGTWTQQPKIFPSVSGYWYGQSIALSRDGSTLIVGGPGDNSPSAIWIYFFNATTSQFVVSLDQASGVNNVNASIGWSTAASSTGTTCAAGGPDDSSSVGAIWVFTWSTTTSAWSNTKLVATGVNSDRLGESVALSDDGTILVGGCVTCSPPNFPQYAGALVVWVFSNSQWVQQSFTECGFTVQGLIGTPASCNGNSVSISGNGALIVDGGCYSNPPNYKGGIWFFSQ